MSWGPLAEYARTFAQLAAEGALVQHREALPAYVHEHTQPGDTVLVWGGDAGVNFLARRDAPTPHFLYGILVPNAITDRISAEFMREVTAEPPALILDGSEMDLQGILPPLSEPDPIAWAELHEAATQPRIREFFDFVHARYSHKTDVAGVSVYYLEPQ
jgi:hypothetical protein